MSSLEHTLAGGAPQPAGVSRRQSILYSVPVLIVLILTLVLLTYVQLGEANRIHAKFQLKKLATQAEIINHAFASYLKADLPLEQFSGFASCSERLLLSDSSIERIQILDTRRALVFSRYQEQAGGVEPLQRLSQRIYHSSTIELDNDTYTIEESDSSFRLTLALQNQVGTVGYAIVESNKDAVFQSLNRHFQQVFLALAILSALLIAIVICYELLHTNHRARKSILQGPYVAGFLALALVIAVVVFQVYEEGAKAKAQALTHSLAQRLSAVMELGIAFDSIAGIDQALAAYKASNPDIQSVALIEAGRILYHTDPELVGAPYRTPPDSYAYRVDLNSRGADAQHYQVAVSLPAELVLHATLASARSGIILFIGCGLISIIFLNACTSFLTWKGRILLRSGDSGEGDGHGAAIEQEGRFQVGLRLVKPAYFLIVFVQALPVSFLPQLVSSQAEASSSLLASASLPFTLYYVFFALVLIPAGRYAERGDLKRMMTLGLLAEAAGMLTVALTEAFWPMAFGRAVSGAGQGVFLIGLQSYLLAVTPPHQRTQGAAVKVMGRNAGLIAGTAIGSLLFVHMDYRSIFAMGALLSVLGVFYLWKLVPAVEQVRGARGQSGAPERRRGRGVGVLRVLRDREFFRTLLLIGLSSKMAVTGVVMFAVPLVLSRSGYGTDAVGQLLMLYYIASMVVTHYTARWVDRLNQTRGALVVSALLGGGGMLLLGLLAASPDAAIAMTGRALQLQGWLLDLGDAALLNYLLIACLLLMGAANGLMAAPVLTHISETRVARLYDSKAVTATYVFLERAGHVAGPLVISQLLLLCQQSTLAISLFGLLTIGLGVAFLFLSRPGRCR